MLLKAIQNLDKKDDGSRIKFMFIMLSYLSEYRTMPDLINSLGKSERQIYRNINVFEEIGFRIYRRDAEVGFSYKIGKIRKTKLEDL